MDYLPIFFELRGRKCLVVGAGNVARRKTELLLRAGGQVKVLAPNIEPTLKEMADSGQIEYQQDVFRPEHLDGMALVISATEKKEINREVAQEAHSRMLPINVVDDPELCSFILPAIVDRSPLVIAVSSGGKSPVLARLLKARLESVIPVAYGRLTQLAGDFRDAVKAALVDPDARRKYWEKVFQGRAATLFLAGHEAEAKQEMESVLATESSQGTPIGRVTLLQAPLPDPELLTLQSLRFLQEADVIVYDPETLSETIDMARRDAERIVVGNVAGQLSKPAEAIPELLVDQANLGQHVVRIRAKEIAIDPTHDTEIAALKKAGIGYHIAAKG